MAKKIVNKDIPISCIKISPHHHERDHSDDEIKDLSASITERGQFHQVLVRPLGKSKQTFELITGKKRLMAVKLAGERTIRCAVVHFSDEDAEIASLEENLMHTELPVRERDAALGRLHDLYKPKVEEELRRQREESIRKAEQKRRSKGTSETPRPRSLGRPKSAATKTVEKVAEKAKLSVARTKKALKRDKNLAPVVQRALETERISVEQADILANLSIPEQREELAKMLQETQRDSRERVSRERLSTNQGDTAVAVRMLQQIAAASVDLRTKVEEVMAFMDSKELDYEKVEEQNMKPAKDLIEVFGELFSTFLET